MKCIEKRRLEDFLHPVERKNKRGVVGGKGEREVKAGCR